MENSKSHHKSEKRQISQPNQHIDDRSKAIVDDQEISNSVDERFATLVINCNLNPRLWS